MNTIMMTPFHTLLPNISANRMAPRFAPRFAQYGQGGLLLVAVAILITLTVGGGLLSNYSRQNIEHSIVTAQSAQAYYAAQAGIQEAIATRMVPRTNYLNFNKNIDTDGVPFFRKAYYDFSGSIARDLEVASSPISKYRYLVLGGDNAREMDGDYFASNVNYSADKPKLLSIDTIPAQNSFIVVSEGITCRREESRYSLSQAGQFETTDAADVLAGACKTGYKREAVLVLAQINLQQPDGSSDQVVRQRIFKSAETNGDIKFILPTGAFVPGYGWQERGSEISFKKAWNGTGAESVDEKNPLTLKKIVFYNFPENQIIRNCTVTGTTTLSGCDLSSIDSRGLAIRLYFNGPVDFRSISPRTGLSDKTLTYCRGNGANNCNIRVIPASTPTQAYRNNTIIPLLPSSTQVILLPPLKDLAGGSDYTIKVDTRDMRSYNGQAGLKNYTITFTTKVKS